jgi:selenoprotein W-related protein
VAEALFGAFRKQLDQVVLIPSGGGVHEIEANGQLIFSKKQTGRQPDPGEIVAKVREII